MCNDEIAPSVGRFLGKGSSKKVYVADYKERKVAILRGCTCEEVRLMRDACNCEYIVQLVAELGPHTIAVELAEHGSLADLQDTLDFEHAAISSDHITMIILQTQKGLNALWDLGFVHSDVAERNVLVFSYERENADTTLVKLGDLGEAYKSKKCEIDVTQLIAMNLRLRKDWAEHLEKKDGIDVVN
tara:strand:- start:105 stop:665 length:561 start_codon:yes stop_codon:yes gene_type:complete